MERRGDSQNFFYMIRVGVVACQSGLLPWVVGGISDTRTCSPIRRREPRPLPPFVFNFKAATEPGARPATETELATPLIAPDGAAAAAPRRTFTPIDTGAASNATGSVAVEHRRPVLELLAAGCRDGRGEP